MAKTVSRYRPFEGFTDLRGRLDHLLGDVGARVPAMDVVRRDDAIVVRVDLPGLKAEEVRVELEDDVLTIAGEHTESTEYQEGEFLCRERRSGSFSRQLRIPRGADPDAIGAKVADGVLEVTVPMPAQTEGRTKVITPEAG